MPREAYFIIMGANGFARYRLGLAAGGPGLSRETPNPPLPKGDVISLRVNHLWFKVIVTVEVPRRGEPPARPYKRFSFWGKSQTAIAVWPAPAQAGKPVPP